MKNPKFQIPNRRLLIFIAIVLLAATLRLYKLNSYPVSLSWDEVAIGYNAYSISKTGADEYGEKWPLLFKSFNDYKLPGYIYTDALFVKFFDLSEFTTRLPSAIFGILAVVAVYFLAKELFEKSIVSGQLSIVKSESIALLAMLMLAISPWHLQFSRGAFEANAALTLVIIGIALLLYGLKNKLAALVSLPILTTSIYYYYSPRIFVPMIVIVFLLIFKDEIQKSFKYYLYSLILSILILIPITIQVFSPQGLKRVQEVSIIGDQSLIVDYVDARAKSPNISSSIFLNRRVPVAFEFLHNYFSHYSPGFLFFGGDPNPRHRSAFHGNLYIFEIPLVILGLWLLARQKDSKTKYFILAWLFIAPLPAALTHETPHSLRALLMLPPVVLVSALGVTVLSKRSFWISVLIASSVFFFINYLYSYFVIYPQRDSLAWAYGYKQMFSQISKIGNNFDRIIVTGHYWKPYIFYLFYKNHDPKIYQMIQNQQAIGKIRFGTTDWDQGGKDLTQTEIEELKGNNTLLVIAPSELATFDDKNYFKQITSVSNYSGKNEIFLIGEWR